MAKNYECDLCKEKYSYICEFVLSAKHVRGRTEENIKLNTRGKQRVSKHICTNCFVKMFPDEVVEKTKDA